MPPTKSAKRAARTTPKPRTKLGLISDIATATELPKDKVTEVLAILQDLARHDLTGKGSPGVFVIPGLIRIKAVRKPATREKQGINHFTKEPITIAAKPARNVLRAAFPKAFRDAIA